MPVPSDSATQNRLLSCCSSAHRVASVSRRANNAFAGARVSAKVTKVQRASARAASKVVAVTGKTYVAEAVADTTINTCINAIRFLSIDGVNKANSGHPGLPMGCAPMSYVLWNEEMKYNPKNPKFFNRDRFVLSAGHGSMLLYSLLYLCGYDSVTLEDLQSFRQWGSKTPGHPENFVTEGIEVTTGKSPMSLRTWDLSA